MIKKHFKFITFFVSSTLILSIFMPIIKIETEGVFLSTLQRVTFSSYSVPFLDLLFGTEKTPPATLCIIILILIILIISISFFNLFFEKNYFLLSISILSILLFVATSYLIISYTKQFDIKPWTYFSNIENTFNKFERLFEDSHLTKQGIYFKKSVGSFYILIISGFNCFFSFLEFLSEKKILLEENVH